MSLSAELVYVRKKYIVSVALLLSVCVGLVVGFTPQVSSAQVKTRTELEAELKDLEAQITEHKKSAEAKSQESASLKRDLSILQSKISSSKKAIKLYDSQIAKISGSIAEKGQQISTLNGRLEEQRVSLGQVLRKQATLDQVGIINFALTDSGSLSNFFADTHALTKLDGAITASFYELQSTKQHVAQKVEELEDAKVEQIAEKQKQAIEMQEVGQTETEKKQLLQVTKGQEELYKKLVADRTARAGQIRNALFSLNGAGDISFGKALEIANKVAAKTGVRASYLLGVIRIESNLGQNVGKGSWKVDMHPTRDQPIFEKICAKLGLDPDKQPVSKKAWYGYGGAMGPAQFIPSTWVMYEDRITRTTGNSPANPWNVEDAFYAAAFLLIDNGAVSGDSASEHRAAMCYLAGCGNAKKASLQFYGDNVLKYAKEFEAKIKILNE